jgi:acyl dehydratase
MPVRAEALGAELEPCTAEVTARMTLAYAAAIGDLGPRTFDDAGEGLLVAPPPFCVRLEWVLLGRSRAGVLGLSEAERLRAVHAEQDSTFHRPIRPGDALVTRARVVAIRATSAGALVQTRLATTEVRTESPVATSWHSAIYRGVGVAGKDGRVEDPPAFPAAPTGPARSRRIPIGRAAAHVYTECTGIWNPIHTERRVALSTGLPDIIVHGTMVWAMAGGEIVDVYAAGDPTRLRRLRARFRAPIVPGHTITLAHGAGAGGDAHFQVANERGETALADGYAEVSE